MNGGKKKLLNSVKQYNMELKIINNESRSIAEKFGISEERKDELMELIKTEFYSIFENRPYNSPLVRHYDNLLKQCGSIEEYTLCMHCLIFNLAKSGSTIDSKEFTN